MIRVLRQVAGRLPACPARAAFDVLAADLSADLTDRRWPNSTVGRPARFRPGGNATAPAPAVMTTQP